MASIKGLRPMSAAPTNGSYFLIRTENHKRNLHLWIVGCMRNGQWRCPTSFHHIEHIIGWMPLPFVVGDNNAP